VVDLAVGARVTGVGHADDGVVVDGVADPGAARNAVQLGHSAGEQITVEWGLGSKDALDEGGQALVLAVVGGMDRMVEVGGEGSVGHCPLEWPVQVDRGDGACQRRVGDGLVGWLGWGLGRDVAALDGQSTQTTLGVVEEALQLQQAGVLGVAGVQLLGGEGGHHVEPVAGAG